MMENKKKYFNNYFDKKSFCFLVSAPLRLCGRIIVLIAVSIMLLSGCAAINGHAPANPDNDNGGWPYLDWRTNYMDVL